VTIHAPTPNRNEPNADGSQKQSAEERYCDHLAAPRVRHEETEVEPGESADPRGEYRDPTRPSVKAEVSLAHARHELQRRKDEKDRAGHYV
jgi:hypothetical protein